MAKLTQKKKVYSYPPRDISPEFDAWIAKTTTVKIGQALNVDPATVRHWRQGRVLPCPRLMREIVKLSKGKISYAIMIEGYFKNEKRAAR